MRLDLFLKLTRLIKRRTLAKEYCDHHLVKVNQQTAKPAREIRVGDEIILSLWNRILKLEVLNLPGKGIKASEASDFYKIIEEQRKESSDELL